MKTSRDRTYKVICISLYHSDLAYLDSLVRAIKKRGNPHANRSWLVRQAVGAYDAAAAPSGALADLLPFARRLAGNLATAAGLQLAFRAGDNAGFQMADHDRAYGEQTYCDTWRPGCGRPYRGLELCPCELRDRSDDFLDHLD